MSNLGNCSLGTDGVPPPAWTFAGPIACDYMEDLTSDAFQATSLPSTCLFVLPPKGEASPEEVVTCRAFREPEDLRPLTLQNEDNKALYGISNHCIHPTTVLFASVFQRCFIPGRTLVQNALDLDCYSRAFSFEFARKRNSAFNDVLQQGTLMLLLRDCFFLYL